MYFRHISQINVCLSYVFWGFSEVQKYVKIESFRGSAPDPAGGAYSAPQAP